jgi:hypothetical protein
VTNVAKSLISTVDDHLEVRFVMVDVVRLARAIKRQAGLAVGQTAASPTASLRLGEAYICKGSLYLFCCGSLPLGLTSDSPFWTSPEAEWTAKKLWSGEDVLANH